jgi:hypothetical protein
MPRFPLATLGVGVALAGAASAPTEAPPTQLDRIERQLDAILRRLDQLHPDQPLNTGTAPQSPIEQTASPPASAAPETLIGGALAIVHAATAMPLAAREIPTDSVGGFIYEGGPLQLADLKDHGVRYTGVVGVEWQGWLRARESGRYQLGLDGNTSSTNGYTNSTCIFLGWLSGLSLGVQEAKPNSSLPQQPAPFSLVLGAELQPGLYRLRLWAVCTPSVRNQRVSVELLEKSPTDLNLRPITSQDLVHTPNNRLQGGSSE